MGKKVVKCMICRKEFDGTEALEHTKEIGHNRWELLIPKKDRYEAV